jgi:hypothetical protein
MFGIIAAIHDNEDFQRHFEVNVYYLKDSASAAAAS